jgi:hypothetical protein
MCFIIYEDEWLLMEVDDEVWLWFWHSLIRNHQGAAVGCGA